MNIKAHNNEYFAIVQNIKRNLKIEKGEIRWIYHAEFEKRLTGQKINRKDCGDDTMFYLDINWSHERSLK